VIDANPGEWTVERLRYIKEVHEASVQRAIEKWKQLPDAGSLIVFCGASSAGKDVVASRVRRNLHEQFGYEIEFLNKYTTRRKRSERESTGREDRIPGSLYEPSSNYDFISSDEFHSNPDCFFPYRKYGKYRYAFSRRHIQSRDPEDRNLACILGALDRIRQFRSRAEKEFNRAVFAVLLEAEMDELYDRLDLRSTFSPEERDYRRDEIRKDLERVKKQREESPDLKTYYDLVVENGRSSLVEAVQCVTDGIGQWLEWRNWTLEETQLSAVDPA
jgi:guanylate kinase